MPHFDFNGRLGGQNRQDDPLNGNLAPDEDLIMEQILENLNTTPIGRQLTEGKYDLSSRLDVALDKVLEDLTA